MKTMNETSGLHAVGDAPLERTARTGIYLVRDVPRELQQTARARAVKERTTLRWVLLQALRDYATGRWTPRRGAE
jgi:hypothetical protein